MAFIVADRVKETTTTTGTGALTLAGTLTGFTSFAARCAVGDTLYYAIQAVDGAGAPTGEWECGLGTYSGTSTLTRTTVTSSSNADAAVSFAAGTKQVFITMPAVQARWARERLTADRTYYVRTDGSDANTGLVNTSGGAFLTTQKAIDTAASLDLGIYAVDVQLADGTYTAGMVLKSYIGVGPIAIKGNAGTPANVLLDCTAKVVDCSGVSGSYLLKDFKLQTTTGGLIEASGTTSIVNFSGLVFGASPFIQIMASSGATVTAAGNYAITAGALAHVYAISGGVITLNSRTVTLTGTPAFSAAFAWSDRGLGMFDAFSMTFSGSATGARYIISNNSVCFVAGAATTYFPGNASGSVSNGGLYA